MLRLLLFAISIFLITIIFLRVPQENAGLASFATKSDVLGSPSSARKFLNILTALGIFLYIVLAVVSNINQGI